MLKIYIYTSQISVLFPKTVIRLEYNNVKLIYIGMLINEILKDPKLNQRVCMVRYIRLS